MRPEHAPHRFSWRVFAAMLAAFVLLFGAELAIDLASSIARTGRPLAEVWPRIEGSWYSAVQAGGCLARAGYSMLGMCVSVFALALPIAATFHTPKLIEVYLRDRVNIAVLGLGILASANTHFQTTVVWSHLFGLGPPPADWAGFHPSIALWAGVALIALAWATILPYALYALRFLTPEVLLARLARMMVDDIDRAARRRADHPRLAARVRQEILDLGNVALRALDRADRDLALDGVRTLGAAYRRYLDRKPLLPAPWFEPRREWFAGLSDDAFRLLVRERTWVGHLLLHQAWLAYAAALAKAPDVAGEIAAEALALTGEAARRGDRALIALGLRFANSMIREVIKRGDPGTVQDVARSHRATLLVLLSSGGDREADHVVEEAEHLAYYCGVARVAGADASADVIALSLARIVEMAAERVPRALAGVAAAFERLADPAPPADARALVKARALVASCLADAGEEAPAARLLARIGRAPPSEREDVRAALSAAATRAEAGREAFGAEPGLEFVPEPRRSRMIAALAAAGA
jgi:hypothetical protein